MKILLLSTFEQAGGAARSAHRLFRQLNLLGGDCRMLVQYRQNSDPLVLGPPGRLARLAGLRPYLDALPLLCYRSRLSPPWSLAWLPNNIDAEVAAFAPDIIHIHGVGHGFLPIAAIERLPGPVVWTLHDSWAFTGGCHLPGSCTRYLGDCGRCPQLNMRHEHDLSRWGWQRKARSWAHRNLTFVAPSRWLASCAQASSLLKSFPIEVIPNGIDADFFAPGDRASARAALGLPLEGVVLLYGASGFTKDENKGFALLDAVLKEVAASLPHEKMTLALFGDPRFKAAEVAGIPVSSFGSLASDQTLVSLYRAANVFILPSLQENLPNTVMEALSCGTPCVAFDVGGVQDLLTPGVNGYLAGAADVSELAKGIVQALSDHDRAGTLGRQARASIEARFSIAKVADRHLELYGRVVADAGKMTAGTCR